MSQLALALPAQAPSWAPAKVLELIAQGALFVVNHSGGKDSQAMLARLKTIVPAHQLVVIYAVLREVVWHDALDHIRATIGDTPLILAEPSKTFFEMVEHRGMFPSPQQRQCTSDLKRGPIEREIRRYLKAHPEFEGRVVNCMGMRAEESSNRAKLTSFAYNAANSKAGRTWYDWLPVHELNTWDVWCTIAEAGQKPAWPYAEGMDRYSCCFCIYSSQHDLATAGRLVPELAVRYAETEIRLDFTLSMTRIPLTELIGVEIPYARWWELVNLDKRRHRLTYARWWEVVMLADVASRETLPVVA